MNEKKVRQGSLSKLNKFYLDKVCTPLGDALRLHDSIKDGRLTCELTEGIRRFRAALSAASAEFDSLVHRLEREVTESIWR